MCSCSCDSPIGQLSSSTPIDWTPIDCAMNSKEYVPAIVIGQQVISQSISKDGFSQYSQGQKRSQSQSQHHRSEARVGMQNISKIMGGEEATRQCYVAKFSFSALLPLTADVWVTPIWGPNRVPAKKKFFLLWRNWQLRLPLTTAQWDPAKTATMQTEYRSRRRRHDIRSQSQFHEWHSGYTVAGAFRLK